jgi:ABC-type transport system substrate-binding protein
MRLRARATAAAAAAVLLLAGLGACSSDASSGGASVAGGSAAGARIAQLTGGDVNFYSTVDPNKTQGCNDNYCGLFLEHPQQLGQGNVLKPELATSVSQPNPLTYVYHLRHGVTFWDGKPMTSADVVYSLNYQSKPGVPTSVDFANVKSIVADGPYAVVITLKQPDAGWKYSLSYEGVIFEKAFALPEYPYDLAKARQEMAESAYPHGFTTAIQTPNYGTIPNVTQVIAAELAQIGIHLQLKEMEVTAWQSVENGPAAKRSTAFSTGGCFQPDPSTYSDFLGSKNTQAGNWNFSDYAPSSVDQLLAQGAASSNPAQRFAAYSKLFNQLQQDVPYVGLFVLDTTAALSSKFTWKDFNPWYWDGAYLLGIKAA